MTEAEALDNQLSLLLSTVSEMVGIDNQEQRRRWQRLRAAYPRTADAIYALLESELACYLAQRRSQVRR